MGELGEEMGKFYCFISVLHLFFTIFRSSLRGIPFHAIIPPPPHQGQNPTLAHSRGVYGLTGLAVIDTKKLVPQENGRRFIAVLQ